MAFFFGSFGVPFFPVVMPGFSMIPQKIVQLGYEIPNPRLRLKTVPAIWRNLFSV